jgi:hypothetical protein
MDKEEAIHLAQILIDSTRIRVESVRKAVFVPSDSELALESTDCWVVFFNLIKPDDFDLPHDYTAVLVRSNGLASIVNRL